MKIILRWYVLVLAFCILCVPYLGVAGDEDDDRLQSDAERIKELMEEAKTYDVDIQLYAQVVDQYNVPVSGADVVLHINQFSPDEKEFFEKVVNMKKRTDDQGLFSVSEVHGSSIYVSSVKKDGYEYKASDNPNDFKFNGEGERKIQAGDKTHPFTFRMRKKGETSFLLQGKSSVELRFDGEKCVELLKRDEDDLDAKRSISNWPGFTACNILQSNGTQQITLRDKHSGDGLLLLGKKTYEAPEQGYRRAIEITIPYATNFLFYYQTNLFLSVQTMKPKCYGLVELDIRARKDSCILYCTSAINPYGERNFEYAIELKAYWKLEKRLKNEAKVALSEGRLVVKPDLKKLIEEAKEKDKGKP